ncbi:hypothetical protein C474_12566 [Halogeometricum pallidum JCM 14848]|uniref:Uncharacterized protein n=1 Tax=Halogeometricum pallidum JCM 14848 TaxID=1227487 RepID=M0D4T8_HALPD|nr:hypothetical protein [Halogeometricum pallidum]ELZ29868.1 hypothetical protein C474_12566 [Halogeometricum pallidum JCM 14848]
MTDDTTDNADEAPTVRSAALSALEGSPEAAIETRDDAVVCRGCVRGRNGSVMAALDDATYDSKTDELRVVVATETDPDAGPMSIQAVVDLGYEVAVEFAGGLPGSVTLVEDDADGRREALTASL